MKKILALSGIALLSTAGLSLLFGQEGRPYSQIMKEIAAANGQVKKALDAQTSREDVASGGQKLVALFKEVEEFWTKRGAADAIEAAKNAVAAANELATVIIQEKIDGQASANGPLGFALIRIRVFGITFV